MLCFVLWWKLLVELIVYVAEKVETLMNGECICFFFNYI